MKVLSSNKPHLIALEGPAGVGKTSLQQFLLKEFTAAGINADILPEFSDSSIGAILRDNVCFGTPKPDWLLGIGGVMAILADKLSLLERAAQKPTDVWVSDRFVTSQFVLGLRDIDSEWQKEVMRGILSLILTWARRMFSDQSFLVYLEAPPEILEERLHRRIGYPLTSAQLGILQQEILHYDQLKGFLTEWTTINLNSSISLQELGVQIVNIVSSKWVQK